VLSSCSSRHRGAAATSTGTRPDCAPGRSRRSARSGPRSHSCRSADPRTARRSHQPRTERARLIAARQPNCPKGHSFRAKSRTERRILYPGASSSLHGCGQQGSGLTSPARPRVRTAFPVSRVRNAAPARHLLPEDEKTTADYCAVDGGIADAHDHRRGCDGNRPGTPTITSLCSALAGCRWTRAEHLWGSTTTPNG
jgi:hypothetical protein